MALGIRSPYTPYSIYLKGTIHVSVAKGRISGLERRQLEQACDLAAQPG